jgi:hypothetical protein
MNTPSNHERDGEQLPQPTRGPGRRRSLPLKRTAATIAALLGLAVLAACGSSGTPSSSFGKPSGSARLAYSACMRSHGVPNFPDPGPGGGFGISSRSGIDPASPSFKSAQESCRKLLRGGGPVSGHPSAQAEAQMLHVSECMRRHGISDFPDPTLSTPSNPTAYSAILDRDGVTLAIPRTISTQSPAFTQAATACHFSPAQ